MFTCYECGKEITDANPGVTFDNLNFAHRDCLYKPVLPVHELDANAWDWIAKETADLRSIMDESASETLCNAPCDAESETSTNVSPDTPLPRVERFSDLPDGTEFYLAQTYAYGGRQALIKTLEDGGEHNAVYAVYGGIGIHINDGRLVIRK